LYYLAASFYSASNLIFLISHFNSGKIGSAVKGNLTHLTKQFNQLAGQSSFNIIDLKDYILWWGILQ